MKYLILTILLTGCIPEVPEIPSGASCTMDGFVLRPVLDDVTNLESLQFVLDETGEAMTCTFN